MFATGVVYTGGKFVAGVVDTGGNFPPASYTDGIFAAGIVDTGGKYAFVLEFSKIFERVLMEYSEAGGKLIHEKNQKQKISWHCPFKYTIDPLISEIPNIFKPGSKVLLHFNPGSLGPLKRKCKGLP